MAKKFKSKKSFRVTAVRHGITREAFKGHVHGSLKKRSTKRIHRLTQKLSRTGTARSGNNSREEASQQSQDRANCHLARHNETFQTGTVSCSSRSCKKNVMANMKDVESKLGVGGRSEVTATVDDHFEDMTVLHSPEQPTLEFVTLNT